MDQFYQEKGFYSCEQHRVRMLKAFSLCQKANTDMKKVLRGGYTCCVPGCYSNTERDKELSFHKFPRDVSLREKWINSIKRKDFIPVSSTVYACSKHSHCAKKQILT